MEALNHDLYIQGHEDYIKTTCVYPYYINTTQILDDMVRSMCKYRFTLTTEDAADQVVQGVLYNQTTVMVPKIASVLFYINCPRFFQKIYLDVMFRFSDNVKWRLDSDCSWKDWLKYLTETMVLSIHEWALLNECKCWLWKR